MRLGWPHALEVPSISGMDCNGVWDLSPSGFTSPAASITRFAPIASAALVANSLRPLTARNRAQAGDTADIVVWGNSHADALFPGIAMIGEDHGALTRK